jgi:tRNA threonylcarbamoyl adenosine modification protein YjeE
MAGTLARRALDEAALVRLAEIIALKCRRSDAVLLHGDLGAGKTTFARALVRAILDDPAAEVPSPTFSLRQDYAAPRLAVAHFDFYRLGSSAELDELGLDEALGSGLVLVEWPERVTQQWPADRLDVHLGEGADADARDVTITAHGAWIERLARVDLLDAFLHNSAADGAVLPAIERVRFLQGDASSRAYARLMHAGGLSTVLMDSPRTADGPPVRDGRPYSRIAHLAEDVRPFVAVGTFLHGAGISAPRLLAHDCRNGFLILEDLGDRAFGREVVKGPAHQAELWRAAVDLLVKLRTVPVPDSLPLPDGSSWTLPRFDRAALEIEVELLLDWYWPHAKGDAADDATRAEFRALWSPLIDRMLSLPAGLFLRDFHSPNLFWLPQRDGLARVGVIDFQDALAEHYAYDLASLLQDARVDVPATLERDLLVHYVASVGATDATFHEQAFRAAYALFGAQRNTRLIGLWVRLWQRDGKPDYMAHMPRTLDYLTRNLAHPELHMLRDWYRRHLGIQA